MYVFVTNKCFYIIFICLYWSLGHRHLYEFLCAHIHEHLQEKTALGTVAPGSVALLPPMGSLRANNVFVKMVVWVFVNRYQLVTPIYKIYKIIKQ